MPTQNLTFPKCFGEQTLDQAKESSYVSLSP
jgi:hypothetical protein